MQSVLVITKGRIGLGSGCGLQQAQEFSDAGLADKGKAIFQD
jgi:hypothetical protein